KTPTKPTQVSQDSFGIMRPRQSEKCRAKVKLRSLPQPRRIFTDEKGEVPWQPRLCSHLKPNLEGFGEVRTIIGRLPLNAAPECGRCRPSRARQHPSAPRCCWFRGHRCTPSA